MRGTDDIPEQMPDNFGQVWSNLLNERKSMRHTPAGIFLISALLLFPACDQSAHSEVRQNLPAIEVYFSPKGGCTEAVVKELDAAESTILVHAYRTDRVSVSDKSLISLFYQICSGSCRSCSTTERWSAYEMVSGSRIRG